MDTQIKKTDFESGRISPIRIIAENEVETNSREGKLQDYIELPVPCLLTINANASAHYGGANTNAGIRVNIRLDGKLVASDLSFEAQSHTVMFHASASTTIYLKPGRYNLEVNRDNIRTNSRFDLRMNYFALFAQKCTVVE